MKFIFFQKAAVCVLCEIKTQCWFVILTYDLFHTEEDRERGGSRKWKAGNAGGTASKKRWGTGKYVVLEKQAQEVRVLTEAGKKRQRKNESKMGKIIALERELNSVIWTNGCKRGGILCIYGKINCIILCPCNIVPHSELKWQNISFDYAPFHMWLIISWGSALMTEIDWLYWPRKRD